MRPSSITLRLALLFSVSATSVLVGVGALTVHLVERHFEDMDLEMLDGKLLLVRHSVERLRTEEDFRRLPQVLGDALVGHEHLMLMVATMDNEVVFATRVAAKAPSLPPQRTAQAATGADRLATWSIDGRRYRGLVTRLATSLASHPMLVVTVAADSEPHHVFIEAFRRNLLLSICCGVVLTALLSCLIARRAMAPVHEIARLAQRISADRLSERLPAHSVPLELEGLARAFNDMLSRLEDSFARLSQFSADLAHELRTPISNVMTQTQVALSTPGSLEDYREVLYSILEENERLARMLGDMLYLAKADNGLMVPSAESVDLHAEARGLFGYYEALVEERNITLRLTGTGCIRGDRMMIRRAISNLLSNAIRHTETGGDVTVGVACHRDGRTELSVTNPGKDISPAHLPRVFDRFYQVDPSRQRSSEGAGLGLAITMSVARAHGASLTVTSAGGLTRFALTFPPDRRTDQARTPLVAVEHA